MDINEVTMLLSDIGFGKSSGRTLLAEACLLYAKGTHKLQDITERIGETHGISSKQVYHRVWKVIQLAWNSPFRSPRMMYDTRVTKVCPSVKKFIKLFVEQKMGGEVMSEWISVKDNMPKEHDSIFKKFKNTPHWKEGMFEKTSDMVNVSVTFENGKRKTYTASTVDGKWRGIPIAGNPVVTHWMPIPEPQKEESPCSKTE